MNISRVLLSIAPAVKLLYDIPVESKGMVDFSNFDRRILYPAPVDMRKGADFFSSTILLYMDMDPNDQNSVYFFINKRRNLIKAYQYDGDNPWIIQIRKSSGTFKWNDWCSVIGTELTPSQLTSMLLGNYPSS